jgi:long-chain acyl-CoA synthetase
MTTKLSTLTDIIRLGAERYPDRVAVQCATPGVVQAFPHAQPASSATTYRELWDKSQRTARALRSRGFERGDRVLLAAPAGSDWLVAFFGILEAGLVAVPIPDAVGPPLVAAVALHTRARLCIVGPDQTALARVLGGVPRATLMDLLTDPNLDCPDQLERTIPVPDASLAVLAFTSGSTARPRAVELTHANVVANLRALMAARQIDEPETMLSMLPPAHLFELVVGQLAPLAIGGRIVYARTLLPNRLVNAIRDHGVTRVLVVPALLEALCRDVLGGLIDRGLVRPVCQHSSAISIAMKLRQLDSAELDRIRRAVRDRIGDSLRAVGLGGAAIAPGWPEVLAVLGIDLDVGYGLTEAGPLVSLGWASQCPAGSVGRPLPGVSVRISPEGEILVQSPGVMHGYFGDVAASRATLEGGWLRTGDRGYLDAGGFLFIAGRIKEAMVTAAGDTLHPEEVEPYYASRLFAEHCVVPLRGPDGNDLPALVVVPREPDTGDDAIEREFDELRAAAPSRYRVTKMVRRAEPLPRTLLGKLKRRELGETLAAKEPAHAH